MKNSFLVAICMLLFSLLHAQQSFKFSPDSALSLFQANNPQEKVFLQTDKETYYSGETIWMKAWCMLDNTPTYLSRILYVDITDPKGNVILKKMFRLDSLSSSSGYFEIPVEAATGTYSINSYTLWMKNFPDYVFKKPVQIYGSDFQNTKKAITNQKDVVSLKFFPEGGNLIAGISNRIGFKATDGFGLPLNFKGYVQDKNGKKIMDISSEHDGMGVTEFMIEPGNSYTAFVNKNVETNLSFSMPETQNEGVSLRVENTNTNKLFILLNRGEQNKARYGKIKIVAQINYTPVFKATLDLDEGQTAVAVNKKDLPAGILQVTAFDNNNIPLAERIAFIENYTFIKPDINFVTKSNAAKALNRISLSVPQQNQESLSCLITSYVPGLSADNSLTENIASSFLVTSDLRGYIHNPGYYFKDKSAQTLHHLDILLLTQGWRRFDWKEIMNGTTDNLKYPVESSINFRGKAFKNNSKTPVENGFVSFIIKAADSSKIMAQADLNKKGEFFLNDVNFKKEADVSFMGTDKSKVNNIVEVKLEPNYIDSLKKSGNVAFVDMDTIKLQDQADIFSKSAIEKLNEQKSKTLEAVTIFGKKIRPEDKLNDDYASGPFRALSGYIIDPSNQRSGKTIWQMIQERVPGVKLEYNADNPIDPLVSFGRFEAFSEDQGLEGEEADGVKNERGVAYFLNEMKVPKDVLNNINVDDVALIKVLKNEAAALGARQGAIAIYTKYGGDGGRAVFEKGYNTIKMIGYEIIKKFYQPDYAYDPSKIGLADNRTTLYWSGDMKQTVNKKYNVQFYNNDIGKKYQVIVQGIDKNGSLIYMNQIIE